MDRKEYDKLEKELDQKDYYSNFRPVKNLMIVFSWFGNLLSLIFSFFFLQESIGAELPEFPFRLVIVSIFLIAFIAIFELLKRFTIRKMITYILTDRKISFESITSFLFVILIAFISIFFASRGAQKAVDKRETISVNVENKYTIIIDSINTRFDDIIKDIKRQKDLIYQAAEQRGGVLYLSDKKAISEADSRIEKYETERKQEIYRIESKAKEEKIEQKDLNKDNQLASLIFVMLIEFIILTGVSFIGYYDYKSFKQYKRKLDTDANYRRYRRLMDYLDFLYLTTGNKVGVELPEEEDLFAACKSSGLTDSQEEFEDAIEFFIVSTIMETSTTRRKIFIKDKKEAEQIIKERFKITI